MDSMKTIDEILTNLEQIPFNTKVVYEDVQPQVSRSDTCNPLLIPSLLVDAKLSRETLRLEQGRLDKLARKRKALRHRKPYTRKRGTVHPRKKEASKRRLMERRWRDNPLGCFLYGYGKKDIDKGLWYEHIAPLWEKYDSRDLTIVKHRGYGTKDRPLTVFTIDVVHKTEGVVYDGNSLELFLLGKGKAL